MLNRVLCVALVLLTPVVGRAGYVEIGATGSYRNSYISELNRTEVRAITGSVAYYFWEMSALELSYTDGNNVTNGVDTQGIKYSFTVNFQMTGLDFVWSFAGRKDPFQPYVKFGAAYQRKTFTIKPENLDASTGKSEGLSPTWGLGFRLMMSEHFALKAGFDTWSSPMNERPVTYDTAAKVGLSWLF